jgi:hypothetical protein
LGFFKHRRKRTSNKSYFSEAPGTKFVSRRAADSKGAAMHYDNVPAPEATGEAEAAAARSAAVGYTVRTSAYCHRKNT